LKKVDSNLVAIFETAFNVLYLLVVWGLVILMAARYSRVEAEKKSLARLFLISFILLAAGDTGHVGFRVVAHLMNTLDKQVMVLGTPMALTGVGSMMTAYTVTMFYMVLVYIWMERFNQKASWFTYFLLAIGIVRLIFMALPANDWDSLVIPQTASLLRNSLLVIQGLGVIGLYLYSSYKINDCTFKWIGWSIVISFAFYTPVILFAQRYPMVGILMIPKTCAYVAVAIIAYNALWKNQNA
jgi:hypothetical protein